MPRFVARQRKHKQRNSENDNLRRASLSDSNVTGLLPISKAEKGERRQKLKEELRAQQPKISSKKQKRLNKYIENKLKNKENSTLLKKLSEAKINTSQLQSSRNLGVRKNSDWDGSPKDAVIIEYKRGFTRELSLSEDESDSSDSYGLSIHTPANGVSKSQNPAQMSSTFGSGLKRPLEVGSDGLPLIKRRKKETRIKPSQELPWEGFDSEGSFESQSQSGNDSVDGTIAIEDDLEGVESEGSADSSEDDGSGESSNEREASNAVADSDPRRSAFKAWATQQINEALGFEPTPNIANTTSAKTDRVSSKIREEEPLPPELQISRGQTDRKAFSVQVDRNSDAQEARLGLPVVREEQKVMEAIHNNPSVVIWGATGSGKTTQLPQFLFEAGYGNPDSPTPGMIGITQPRRVAAVSMAKRVSDELGQYGSQVSYQIRFESTVSNKTAIKFMTDGILIRDIAQDFALSKYSVIIIDEAHERSVNTDILIGMVSRIVDLRASMNRKDPFTKPLKLVIMSATLRISDFIQNSNLFRYGPPPLVQTEGRQYPVTIHFARRTQRDYVEEAFRKISKGHRKLPAGGFLVFLTGQNEIKDLSKRLKQTLPCTQDENSRNSKVQISAAEVPLETDDIELGGADFDPSEEDDDSDVEFTGLENSREDKDFEVGESVDVSTRIHLLPLHSQLPTNEQLRVFEATPEGSRLIVLATNVAETSLTIPGIRYVFDCGRSKERQYDLFTGVQSFQVGWISKASAGQRAGRAGRTGPGHCYRLYSSAVYERDFPEHTDPEILRTPIEGVVLQMKSMGLHHILNFPFPTPPDRQSLVNAEKLLKNVGALSAEGQVNEIGRSLSVYPLSPRFGKILLIGHQHGCMPFVIAMVAGLAVSDLFIPENQLDLTTAPPDESRVYPNEDQLQDTAREKRRKEYNRAHHLFSKHDKTSDALKLLTAVCAYSYAPEPDNFCKEMFLRSKALEEASQLRHQLTDIVRGNNPGLVGSFEARLPEPSEKQLKALKQIVTAGFIDQVAIRADLAPVPPEMPRKPRRAIDVPYLTLFHSSSGRAGELDEKAVYVHPSSVLAHTSPKDLPQYIVYSHLQRSSASLISDNAPKVRMFPLTAASGAQLSALAHGTPLINYGKPIGKIASLGGSPERRECWVIPSMMGEAGSTGWPLPAKKVVQRRDFKQGWVIEKFLS